MVSKNRKKRNVINIKMMMKIKLVIFDLDGTLLNSIKDITLSLNEALSLHSYPTHSAEVVVNFVGNGVEELIYRALPEDKKEDKEESLKVLESFKMFYKKNGILQTERYDGVNEMLALLADEGVLCAVASNKYQLATEEVVNHYFDKDIFTMIEGKRDDRPAKPNPQIIFDIISKCNVDKSEVLYVGDSDVDMCTAVSANVTAVGVTWGYRSEEILLESGANHIITFPEEILNLV